MMCRRLTDLHRSTEGRAKDAVKRNLAVRHAHDDNYQYEVYCVPCKDGEPHLGLCYGRVSLIKTYLSSGKQSNGTHATFCALSIQKGPPK
jgi:hypothetical protein